MVEVALFEESQSTFAVASAIPSAGTADSGSVNRSDGRDSLAQPVIVMAFVGEGPNSDEADNVIAAEPFW